jgi:hypothetical protein
MTRERRFNCPTPYSESRCAGGADRCPHLSSVTQTSGGKFTLPFVDVQASFYASNFMDGFKTNQQVPPTFCAMQYRWRIPILIWFHDYGMFVREGIELPEFGSGKDMLSGGELISIRDCILQLANSKIFADNHRDSHNICLCGDEVFI